jgi:hypothetical protein
MKKFKFGSNTNLMNALAVLDSDSHDFKVDLLTCEIHVKDTDTDAQHLIKEEGGRQIA